MTRTREAETVSLDKPPKILRPLPGKRNRDAEWEEWGQLLDRQRFYDPPLNWLDEHPITSCLLVGVLVTGLFLLLAMAMT